MGIEIGNHCFTFVVKFKDWMIEGTAYRSLKTGGWVLDDIKHCVDEMGKEVDWDDASDVLGLKWEDELIASIEQNLDEQEERLLANEEFENNRDHSIYGQLREVGMSVKDFI